MKRSRYFIFLLLGLLILLGIGGFFLYEWYRNEKSLQALANAKSPDKLFTVKRSNLTIGVLLTGSITTKVKHKLALDVPMSTKLSAIVDENVHVSAGDIVARFETEDLQTKIDDYKVELDNKEKDLLIAQEERAILLSSNSSDIRSAEDAVVAALDSYNRYKKLEGPQDKDQQNLSVSDALKSLEDARSSYQTAYDNLHKAGGTVPKESQRESLEKAITTAEKAVTSAEVSYRNAILTRKIFKRYTYPTKIKDVKNKLDQARLDLNKVKVKTTSSLAQKDNQIYNAEQNVRRIARELEKSLSYMSGMQLVAPVDGFVTYGDPDRRWGNTEVKVGMDVGRRMTLITIPDMNRMIIDVNIPEQFRSKISVGDSLVITPDSIPTLKIDGKISHIQALPVNVIPWDSGSQKVYRSEVDFKTSDPRVVSGMSVQVEVVSQVLKNVISIPTEAVFEEGGKFFVYKETATRPQPTDVELGTSNDNSVEIKSGLEEGDVIYLYRPYQSSQKE